MPNQHIIPKWYIILHMYIYLHCWLYVTPKQITTESLLSDMVDNLVGLPIWFLGIHGKIWEAFTRDQRYYSFTGQMFVHHPIGVELVAAQGSHPSPLSERTNEVRGDVLLLEFRWPAWAGAISSLPQRSDNHQSGKGTNGALQNQTQWCIKLLIGISCSLKTR